jgi:uncharacterized repeat protein (TIGR02543 family)
LGWGGGVHNLGKFIMAGGEIFNNTATQYGGAVANDGGDFSLLGGKISNNTAPQGGGVYDSGNFNMIHGTITNNTANQSGGAVYIDSTGHFGFFSGLISNNTAFYNATLGFGGGVYNHGRFTLYDDGVIYANTAVFGGGIYNNGSFSLTHSEIFNNTATIDGGGIYATTDTASNLIGGTISGNTAVERGGGIFGSGNFTLTDCTVSNNIVAHDGGGVYNLGNFTLINSIISGNIAGDGNTDGYGGGIFNKPFTGLSFNMFKALILNNTVTYRGGGVYNDVGILNVFDNSRISGNIANDNGGGVYNYGELSWFNGEISNNAAYSYDTSLGGGGGVYNGARFSMFNGTIFSNIAYNNGGGVNNFANTFTLFGGTIFNNIASNAGGGVYNTGSSSSFTASGGLISENKANVNGGGVYINSGNFTVLDITIFNNTAEVNGGGVYLADGSMKLLDGVISNNKAELGSGIFTSGTFSMLSGVISHNAATDGGGIYLSSGLGELFSGTISNNTASNNGGGVWVAYTNLNKLFVYDGMIFSNNHASIAYDRNPIDDALYHTQIGSNVVWTNPLIQGYNNYDISYTNGTPAIFYTVTVNNSYDPISGAGTYVAGANVTINAGTLPGYTFTDWIVNQGGLTLPTNPTTTFIMLPTNVTVTANWQAREYTIFYNANTGSGLMNSTSATFKEFVTLSTNTFSKDDYAFIAWNTEADGSGITYGKEMTFNYTYTDDLTLYAVWFAAGGVNKVITGTSSSYAANEPIEYTVSYLLPSDLSSVESFVIIDNWAPASGLTYAGYAITVNSLPITSGFNRLLAKLK